MITLNSNQMITLNSNQKNYYRLTAEQVWDAWTEEQREHFLRDHVDGDEMQQHKEVSADVVKQTYGELSDFIKRVVTRGEYFLKRVVTRGEYKSGGGVEGSKELDDWYGRQPFDNVKKITGVDLYEYPEADDSEFFSYHDDENEKSRDEAIDEARELWDEMDIEEKKSWRERIGDNFASGGAVGETSVMDLLLIK